MKFKSHFRRVILSILLLFPMVGCAQETSSVPEKWSYSKEDTSDFSIVDAVIDTESNPKTFTVDSGTTLFNRSLNESDLLVFDMSKATEEIQQSEDDDYLTYTCMKKYEISPSSLQTNEDLSGFSFQFNSDNTDAIAALISKDCVFCDSYLLAMEKVEDAIDDATKDKQTIFEENYAGSKLDAQSGKLLLSIGNVILAGGASALIGNPAPAVSAILSLFSSLGSQFLPQGLTLASLMDKLNTIENEIYDLSQKVSKEFKVLEEESVRTQAMINESLFLQTESAINSFVTDYVEPLTDYDDILADAYASGLKTYTSNGAKSVTLDIYQKNNAWNYCSLTEDAEDSKQLTVNITSFPNSTKFLSSKRRVKKGFMEAYEKDINAAVDSTSLPAGMSKDECASFVMARIGEEIFDEYFSSADHHREAVTLCTKAVNYCQRIIGGNTTSIIASYLNRLEFMYNFGNEIKSTWTKYISYLKHVLDSYALKVTMACELAGVDYDKLELYYSTARDTLTTYYENVMNIPANYCFPIQKKLTGGFYSGDFHTYFTDIGNHPDFHAQFELNEFTEENGKLKFASKNINDVEGIQAIDHSRIKYRWDLMKKYLSSTSDLDYMHYLNANGVISSSSLAAYNFLLSLHKITDASYRIFTEYRVRQLTERDTGMEITCTSSGNPGGSYFDLYYGNRCKYRDRYEGNCWGGNAVETTFLSAIDASTLSDTMLCAYATYSEGHGYWTNDERWFFSDTLQCKTFFMVSVEQEKAATEAVESE